MKIALIPNFSKANALSILKDAYEILYKNKAEILVQNKVQTALDLDAKAFDNVESLIESCDICVVIGGDGTTIHYACIAAKYSKPVLGINAGRVGYISELESSELYMLSKLFEGYETEKRMLLSAEIISQGKTSAKLVALNDMVLSRGSLSQIVEFKVSQNGGKPCRYRADGLIFSSPTGSTAYSFSAGGPVVDPQLECILLSPVCAQLPTLARTVVFSSESELSVTAENQSKNIYLTADGEASFRIGENDIIRIKKSDISASFIRLKDRSFYITVNEKIIGG